MAQKILLKLEELKQSYWFLTILALVLVNSAWSQMTLHSDSFSGTIPTYPNPYLSPNFFTSAGITAQGLSVGAGATGATGTSNMYVVRNWGQTTLVNAKNTNDYIQFTLTPADDTMIDISEISFLIARQNDQSPNRFTLEFSRPSMGSPVVLGTQTITSTATTTLAFSNLLSNQYMNNINETITIRLYAYGTTGVNSSVRVFIYAVNGNNEKRPLVEPTSIWASQCGATLAGLDTPIYSISEMGADRIRFKVSRQDNPSVEEVIEKAMTNSTYFRLTELQTIPLDFNAVYLVSVQIRKTYQAMTFWSTYGEICSVRTPFIPTTQVVTSQCNTTLNSIDAPVYSASVQGSSLIRFKVSLLGYADEIIEKVPENGSSFIRLTELQTIPLQFGTTYEVSVQYQKNYFGDNYWSDYGQVCSITTPNMPVSRVVASLCNTTLSSNTTPIYNTSVSGANTIRFKVWKTDTPGVEEVIEKSASGSTYFRLTELQTLTVEPSVSYSVSVQYKRNYFGTEYWSAYGPVCTVTTPSVAARSEDYAMENVKAAETVVKAYPNPFFAEFQLTLASELPSTIKIFDQSGRLIEEKHAAIGESPRFGSNYQSGVYLIVVNQGGQDVQLRAVKR